MFGNFFMVMAGLFGVAGVAMGAHGSHGGFTSEASAHISTASHYLLFHAAILGALTAIGLQGRFSRTILRLSGLCLTIGAVLFSGSLYLHHAMQWPMRLAPTGGGLLIIGWALLIILPLWRRGLR